MAAGDFTAYGIIDSDKFKSIINNLQLSGGGSSNQYGKQIGGRIGYNIPLEDGNINAGVSGYGYKYGNQSGAALSGIDASYSQGANTYGIDYSRMSPEDYKLMLNYTRAL